MDNEADYYERSVEKLDDALSKALGHETNSPFQWRLVSDYKPLFWRSFYTDLVNKHAKLSMLAIASTNEGLYIAGSIQHPRLRLPKVILQPLVSASFYYPDCGTASEILLGPETVEEAITRLRQTQSEPEHQQNSRVSS